MSKNHFYCYYYYYYYYYSVTPLIDFAFFHSSVSQEGGVDHSTVNHRHSLCQFLLIWMATIGIVPASHSTSHSHQTAAQC